MIGSWLEVKIMGLWTATDTEEGYVDLWLPALFKEGWPAVKAALLRGADGEPEEAAEEEISVALAAAVIVAAARQTPDEEMPAEVAEWVAENHLSLDAALAPLAVQAIDRADVFYNWGEDDDSAAAAAELRSALGAIDEEDMHDSPKD
jgi:hypothetical protein